MRLVLVESSLRASESTIVLFPVFLHDTLQRTVWHIGVARPQQKQIGQHTREPPIAILKRMDRQKAHDEDGDNEKRMMHVSFKLPDRPPYQFLHQSGRVRRPRGFEDNAHAAPALIERFDIVWDRFITAAVVLISRRKLEERDMHLLDVIL